MDYSKDDNDKKKNMARSKRKKGKNKALTITFRVLIATFLISAFALGGLVLGAYIGIIENASKMSNMSVHPNMFTSIVYDMHGNEAFRYTSAENREYVSLDSIPIHLQNAFIAIEDERFYSHSGVDVRGIARAIQVTLFTDRREGGSTITQQLVKNNVLGINRNTFETKIQEQFLAVRLERQLKDQLGNQRAAKNHILEVYLNTIYLANGLNGVQTASRFYFNKDVSELTLSESAVIAGITQNPSAYNPVRFPENNRQRQLVILNRMLAQGLITQAEHDEAVNDDVYARVSEYRNVANDESTIHSYFSDHLFEVVRDDLIAAGHVSTEAEASNMIFNGGLRIHTTLDPNIQSILEETYLNDSFFPQSEYEIVVTYYVSVQNSITDEITHHERKTTVRNQEAIQPWVDSVRAELEGEHGVVIAERTVPVAQPQSAMVVMDHSTGQIRGIVGGRGEKTANRALNRATQSPRQPGSAFKMLAAYAPAMDLGLISPGSMLDDSPLNHNGYRPSNYNNNFIGPVSVRNAIRDSLNVVAVKTMLDVGIDTAFNYLLQFGFTTLADGDVRNGQVFTDRGPATALGGLTTGVTQLELTAAYATIANLGVYIEPTVYTQVLDHEGNVLLDKTNPESRQVLQRTTAYLLTDTMKDVVSSGTGRRAALNTNMPVAGKTGTSQNSKDLTFVGYTPYYVAGVWLGHDDGDKSISTTTTSHLNMWAHVMNQIHADLPVKQFERPSGIVSASICMDSGLLAIPGLCDHDHRGSRITTDLFDVANLPTLSCNAHGSYVIDTLTGLPATEDTPEYRRRVVVGTVGSDGNVINNDIDDLILDEHEDELTEDDDNIPPTISEDNYSTYENNNNTTNTTPTPPPTVDNNQDVTITPPSTADTNPVPPTSFEFEPIPEFDEVTAPTPTPAPIENTSPPESQEPPPLAITTPNELPPIIE